MRCFRKKHENPDTQVFCGQCGALLQTAPGTDDNYEILEPLGKGGMGEVFMARQRQGRVVALKVPNLSQLDSSGVEKVRARLNREYLSLSTVKHEGVAQVLHRGALKEASETPYFVQEYLSGLSLFQLIEETRTGSPSSDPSSPLRRAWPMFSSDFALNLCLYVAEALDAIHAEQIAHRDIKPHNIMLRHAEGSRWGAIPTRRGLMAPVIIDFGIAERPEGTYDSGQRTAGSWPYSPPEQFFGSVKPNDLRQDVHALAAVAYELLTGTTPYSHLDGEWNRDRFSTLARIQNGKERLKGILEFDPTLPPAVAQVVEKGLSPKPQDRWPTVKMFALAWVRAAFGLPDPVPAHPPGLSLGELLAPFRSALRLATKGSGVEATLWLAEHKGGGARYSTVTCVESSGHFLGNSADFAPEEAVWLYAPFQGRLRAIVTAIDATSGLALLQSNRRNVSLVSLSLERSSEMLPAPPARVYVVGYHSPLEVIRTRRGMTPTWQMRTLKSGPTADSSGRMTVSLGSEEAAKFQSGPVVDEAGEVVALLTTPADSRTDALTIRATRELLSALGVRRTGTPRHNAVAQLQDHDGGAALTYLLAGASAAMEGEHQLAEDFFSRAWTAAYLRPAASAGLVRVLLSSTKNDFERIAEVLTACFEDTSIDEDLERVDLVEMAWDTLSRLPKQYFEQMRRSTGGAALGRKMLQRGHPRASLLLDAALAPFDAAVVAVRDDKLDRARTLLAKVDHPLRRWIHLAVDALTTGHNRLVRPDGDIPPELLLLFPGSGALFYHVEGLIKAEAGELEESIRLQETAIKSVPRTRAATICSKGRLMSSWTRAVLFPDVREADPSRLRFVANRAQTLSTVALSELDEEFWWLYGFANARLFEAAESEQDQGSAQARIEKAIVHNNRVRLLLAQAQLKRGQVAEALSQLQRARRAVSNEEDELLWKEVAGVCWFLSPDMGNAMAKAQEELEQALTQVDELGKDVEGYERANDTYEEKLARQRDEIQERAAANRELQQRVEDLNRETNRLGAENERLSRRNAELETARKGPSTVRPPPPATARRWLAAAAIAVGAVLLVIVAFVLVTKPQEPLREQANGAASPPLTRTETARPPQVVTSGSRPPRVVPTSAVTNVRLSAQLLRKGVTVREILPERYPWKDLTQEVNYLGVDVVLNPSLLDEGVIEICCTFSRTSKQADDVVPFCNEGNVLKVQPLRAFGDGREQHIPIWTERTTKPEMLQRLQNGWAGNWTVSFWENTGEKSWRRRPESHTIELVAPGK